MKKLLTFLTLLTLFFGVGWAGSVTLDMKNGKLGSSNFSPQSGSANSPTATSGDITVAFGGNNTINTGTGKAFIGWNNNTTLTVSHSTYNITKVVLNYNSQTTRGTITASTGTLNHDATVMTWTVGSTDTKTVTITRNTSGNQIQLTSIEVTYDDGGSQATSHDITYAEVTGGTFSGPASAAEGDEVTIQATPSEGYNFGSWNVTDNSGAITVTDNKFTMGTSDVTVSGTFVAKPKYDISVTNGIADLEKAYEGQTVTLLADLPDGKVVDMATTTITPSSVTLSGSGDTYTFTMPNEAVTVVFAFMDAPTTQTATLTNANIVDAGTGQDGYRDWTLTDENGKTWNAHAIKNQHSNATSSYHFLQIKKSTDNEQYYLQVPEYGTKIVKLEMTVSNASQPMTGGSNSATLYFSNSNTTSATGTGVASATGSSSVTIDCSSLNLNSGYITASGAVRIWDVIVTYESGEVVEVPDLYILGQVNGNDAVAWNPQVGPQMTYRSGNNTYSADVYCTGIGDNNEVGYSYFAFATELNTWDNLNANNAAKRYGSGATGDYWGIGGTDESEFDTAIPLYKGSKKSYRLAPGLYTFTVDLTASPNSLTVTERDVTLSISPSSGYFGDTQTVTLASNLSDLGGKIYYTTDGTEPSATNGTEYTGSITLDATTTIKAIAILGMIKSDVVEKTYTKTPAAPVISPASCTFNEPLTVIITAESGATIYYTIDGSNPTDQSTLYTGPFTVSGATTTVKAKAYVNGVYGSTATATYTYSNVQPSTGDFVLVTNSNELIAGNEYIIVTTYEGLDDNWDPVVFNYAMSALTTGSNPKGSRTTDFTLTGTIGASGSRIAAGSEVNVLTLGGSAGAWTLKQQDGNYISLSTDDTNISGKASSTPLLITVDSNEYDAYIGNNGSSNARQILYQIGSANVFGNYKSSNVGDANFPNVYLYTRESNSVQPPVFTPAAGIYNVDVDVTISCATDGATIYYTTDGSDPKTSSTRQEYTGEIVVSATTTIKAIAVKGDNSSSVVTAEYTINKSTEIQTVTLDYSEPFTAGIGKFTIDNVSGYSPVWSLDGNYGVKGTAYNANTNPTNNAAVSRLVSPIIDMTDATQPELTFSHQINSYFTDVTNQCQLFIRETTDGTDGTWVQLPITFSDPAAAGGWTNDVVDIDLTDVNGVSYAGKKVQISFLYTNPTAGSGAGTWEIQNFVVADNSEYRMVNNIAEFLALENGTKAKFRNPVTVLYDYAQHSSNSYHEYIWVKDESGYMQFYLIPTLNSGTSLDNKAAYYENGDIIPAGFVVVKNYYENGKFVQAYSADALEAGFLPSTQKGLADPEYMDFGVLDDLDASNTTDVANWSNHYITLEKIKLTSSSKSFNFQDENGNVNACVGYNKYNGDGSLLKDGNTSADVIMPTDITKFYNVKGIIQLWQGGWEFMPIEFTEWKAEEVTLRKLCADGVEQNTYTISNPLQVVYVDTDRKSVWVKDGTGQSIWSTSPEAPNAENFAIEYASNTRSQQAYYDQSNWCQLVFDDEIPTALVNLPIINGGMITGKFTNKMNPTLENVELGENFVQTESSSYTTNYYMAANFNGPQKGYFLMNPKPQEYADIVWAIYDEANKAMIMTSNPKQNPYGFVGSFKVNMSMNINPSLQLVDGTQTGKGYEHFKAIVRLASTSKAPMLKDRMPENTEYVVFPLDITQDVPTGITDVNGKAVKSVKYVNVAGMVSDRPFQGVNIVVTEYSDGSRSTSKMLRK